jgi:hypothetical protein
MRANDQKIIASSVDDRLSRMASKFLAPSAVRRLGISALLLLVLTQLVSAAITQGGPQDKPRTPASDAGKSKGKAIKKKNRQKTAKSGRATEESLQEARRVVIDLMGLAFSPDSDTVAFTKWAVDYKMFELTTGKELLSRWTAEPKVPGHDGRITDVVMGSKGRQ